MNGVLLLQEEGLLSGQVRKRELSVIALGHITRPLNFGQATHVLRKT